MLVPGSALRLLRSIALSSGQAGISLRLEAAQMLATQQRSSTTCDISNELKWVTFSNELRQDTEDALDFPKKM